MKARSLLFCCLFCLTSISCLAQNYVFFLHNRFIEDNPLAANHPEYGNAHYLEIINAFKKADLKVISEKRPANTDVNTYSLKVVKQIDSLLKRGVKPSQITVIGTSKGGYIAQYVSSNLKNPTVNFVFIGCYRDSDIIEFPDINYCGNILMIYEKSDIFNESAIQRKLTSKLKINRFKEIELITGLKHGFLFKPMSEWIVPAIKWANGNYQ